MKGDEMKRIAPLLTVVLLLASAGYAQISETTMDRSTPYFIFDMLTLIGSFFILVGALGMFRFPDFYTRLHASTKVVTLGGFGIFLGAAFVFNDTLATTRLLLIAMFFLLTAPLSGYMVARSGYLHGLTIYEEENSVDEWGECGSEGEEPSEESVGA